MNKHTISILPAILRSPRDRGSKSKNVGSKQNESDFKWENLLVSHLGQSQTLACRSWLSQNMFSSSSSFFLTTIQRLVQIVLKRFWASCCILRVSAVQQVIRVMEVSVFFLYCVCLFFCVTVFARFCWCFLFNIRFHFITYILIL